MKLYTYVVARDYGFAPNPFFGICTLATCKPIIRKQAQVGDWIAGTGSKHYGLAGHLVCAMKVSDACSYDEYWNDARSRQKRPNLQGSIKQAFGDNIYHRDTETGRWLQENSHHSLPNGRPNYANVRHDTQAPRVLIGSEFIFWGREAPAIPRRFRRSKSRNVCCVRGHKCNFAAEVVQSFVAWIESFAVRGFVGRPSESVWD